MQPDVVASQLGLPRRSGQLEVQRARRLAASDVGRPTVGDVAELRRHAELVQSNDLYARLARLQFDAARAAE